MVELGMIITDYKKADGAASPLLIMHPSYATCVGNLAAGLRITRRRKEKGPVNALSMPISRILKDALIIYKTMRIKGIMMIASKDSL
jgi:hypothetical protein